MVTVPNGVVTVRETYSLIHEAIFGVPLSWRCSSDIELSKEDEARTGKDEAAYFASLLDEWMPRFIVQSIIGIGLSEGWVTAYVVETDQFNRIPSEHWTGGTTECLSLNSTTHRFPPSTALRNLPVQSIVFKELELAEIFGSISVWRNTARGSVAANATGSTSSPPKRRGAPEKYPWAEATQDLREKLVAEGVPFSGHRLRDWRSVSDATKLVLHWFSERGLDEPGGTQTRKLVKRIIEEFKKEQFH